jgi:hypothetical protein
LGISRSLSFAVVPRQNNKSPEPFYRSRAFYKKTGLLGIERNDVTSCKNNNLRISQNSSGTLSGTLSANSPQAPIKSKVELILTLIRELTPAEWRELKERLQKGA